MKRTAGLWTLTLCALAIAEPALAIPAFARRYKVECHFCHDGYPKLNMIGMRFKERGFRMEREDAFDAAAWIRSIPVVLRAEGQHVFVEEGADSNYGFLKFISAGNLGSRFSYWADDGLFITSGDTTHTKPDNLWGRVEILTGTKLYLKAGRMELDLPFTQARTPHLLAYQIWQTTTGREQDILGEYHEGVELGGDLPQDAHWSISVVDGRFTDTAGNGNGFDPNFYLRFFKRFERNRVGAFAQIGKNTYPAVGTIPSVDNDLLRLGADASVWVDRVNLYGVAMYARDSNSMGDNVSRSFSGGFLQADYHVHDLVVLNLRLDVVNRPASVAAVSRDTFATLSPGFQFIIVEHGKLSFEYAFENKGRPGHGAAQIEVAF
jgi:hypothetical protein